MDLLDEIDTFFVLALAVPAHLCFYGRNGVVTHVATEIVGTPTAAPTRSSETWGECLRCGALVDVGAEVRGRFRGICDGCYPETPPAERAWYRRQIERWRKWSATRFHAEVFKRGPCPWQITLYSLNKLMLGFGTAPGSEGTERAGLDEHLGVDADEIMAMCRGSVDVTPAVKAGLVEHGARLFALWKDTED